MIRIKILALALFIFLTVLNIQSQEVDGTTSATTTLFSRFLKNSYEYGVEKALMRSDLEKTTLLVSL